MALLSSVYRIIGRSSCQSTVHTGSFGASKFPQNEVTNHHHGTLLFTASETFLSCFRPPQAIIINCQYQRRMECDSIQYAYLAVSYQAPWWDNLYMSGIINHSFCQLELPGSEHVLNSVLLVRGPNIPPIFINFGPRQR